MFLSLPVPFQVIDRSACPHVAGNEYWLANATVSFGHLIMSRWKCSGCAFAMDAQNLCLVTHPVFFEFRDVVGNIMRQDSYPTLLLFCRARFRTILLSSALCIAG